MKRSLRDKYRYEKFFEKIFAEIFEIFNKTEDVALIIVRVIFSMIENERQKRICSTV